MKIYIFITLVLTLTICNSQIKSGSVQYGIISNKNGDIKGGQEMTDFFAEISKASDKIEYTLNFKQNEAYFFANNILLEGNIDFNLAASMGGKIKYYQNNSTKEFREYHDSKRTGQVVVNEEQKYEWTLLNETKTIDGYKCFKASSPLFRDKVKSENTKFIITAWYTPQIPIPYGPNGYGNLPGLILELQSFKTTLYVKKINLTLDKEPEIDKLLSPKAVSHENYIMMVMGTFTKEQLEGMKEVEENQKK